MSNIVPEVVDWARSTSPGYEEVVRRFSGLDEDIYLAGGAVRDYLLGMQRPGDLDFVVPNGDRSVHHALRDLPPPKRNRHGNWRYILDDGSHIDIIEPRFFYKNFNTPLEAISYFDISVNAVAVNLRDGAVLDPWQGVADCLSGVAQLPRARWSDMRGFEAIHLLLRLERYLNKCSLYLLDRSAVYGHLKDIDSVDWQDLGRLHGITRDEARSRLSRIAGTPSRS